MDRYEERAQRIAMQQTRDAQNNLLSAKAKWDYERDLKDQLSRIEDKLDKLLANNETKED